MTEQAALELDIDEPATDAMVLRMTIPAVEIIKKKGMRPQLNPQPMSRPRTNIIYVGGKPQARIHDETWAIKEMQRIRTLWQELCFPPFPEQVPLAAKLTFAFGRPKTHLNAAGQVKEQFMRLRPTARGGGDVDNLEKMVLDGLSTYRNHKKGIEELGAFEADDQVVACLGLKFFVDQVAGIDRPGTIVEIWTL